MCSRSMAIAWRAGDMTYHEAQMLLDAVKDGQPVPLDVVTEALFMTGDGEDSTDLPCPDIQAFVQAMRDAGLL
jgi:hypothetical protein